MEKKVNRFFFFFLNHQTSTQLQKYANADLLTVGDCGMCVHVLLQIIVKPTANWFIKNAGARCSSVVRSFAHGAMGRRIDPSWGGPIELFLVPASAPRLV